MGKRILVEIGHPAHVHFFARSILELQAQGHFVLVVTRNKEITNALLDRIGIPFRCLSAPARGSVGLFVELVSRWKEIHRIIRRDKIDIAISISGISTSVPARLAGIRSITFTDTEDARISNFISFPFTNRIYTPQFFLKDLGSRHQRYQGLHELAYLQDFDFERARERRKTLGLPDSYSVIRLVSNDALHDRDIQGLKREAVREMIAYLSQSGSVFISSQGKLDREFEKHSLQIPLEEIHSVLAGAQLFIGESPTMAVESSLLGTPAYLVSGRVHRLGNMIGLEKDFDLLRNAPEWASLAKRLPSSDRIAEEKSAWTERAARFRRQCVDMRKFIFETLEGT